jgi:hypothetical protein
MRSHSIVGLGGVSQSLFKQQPDSCTGAELRIVEVLARSI